MALWPFGFHCGGVGLGAAEETRACGGGAEVWPPVVCSFCGEGTYATADVGTAASGSVGPSGGTAAAWALARTKKHGSGAELPPPSVWSVVSESTAVDTGIATASTVVGAPTYLAVAAAWDRWALLVGGWERSGVVGVTAEVSTLQSSATSGAVFALNPGALVRALRRRERGRRFDFRVTSKLLVYFFYSQRKWTEISSR